MALLVVPGLPEIQYNGVFYSLSGGPNGTAVPDEVIHYALKKHADKMPFYKGTVVPQPK